MDAPDDIHFQLVANAIRDGTVIPFLGAGVNLADRGEGAPWQPPALPNGRELAEYLTTKAPYPANEAVELTRVSQYVGTALGAIDLYNALHHVFAAEYQPNAVHRFLARLPALLRAEEKPQLLVITTNYDDALERAFAERGEAFDLVYYEAKRLDPNCGKLFHRPPGGEFRLIERPNEYRDLDPDARPVILKIHGAVDRTDPSRDSYVITEDDYIDYLTRSDVSHLAVLKARMLTSHCLFLGYSLQDWNLRVLLNQIWGARKLASKSWAVQKPDPSRSSMSIEVERELWDDRGKVALIFAPLLEYVTRLGALLPEPKPAETAA